MHTQCMFVHFIEQDVQHNLFLTPSIPLPVYNFIKGAVTQRVTSLFLSMRRTERPFLTRFEM